MQVVDGSGSVEEVNEGILKALGKDKVHATIRDWEQRTNILITFVGLPGSGVTTAVKHLEDEKNHITLGVHSLDQYECLKKLRMFCNIKTVVLDGITSYETYKYLQNNLKNTKVIPCGSLGSKKHKK